MSEPKLPPLPLPFWTEWDQSIGEAWTEEQISYYGLQCYEAGVLAERERAARLCETLDHGECGGATFSAGIQLGSIGCANAIRKGEAL